MNKVLVIDDDTRIHTLIKAQFDPKRFEMISAYNGSDRPCRGRGSSSPTSLCWMSTCRQRRDSKSAGNSKSIA